MAKNWKTVFSSNNDYEVTKNNKDRNYEKLMGKTVKKNIYELKKEGNAFYDEDQLKKENLIYAFDNHMLKSNNLIKKAILIKKSENKKGGNLKDGSNN